MTCQRTKGALRSSNTDTKRRFLCTRLSARASSSSWETSSFPRNVWKAAKKDRKGLRCWPSRMLALNGWAPLSGHMVIETFGIYTKTMFKNRKIGAQRHTPTFLKSPSGLRENLGLSGTTLSPEKQSMPSSQIHLPRQLSPFVFYILSCPSQLGTNCIAPNLSSLT